MSRLTERERRGVGRLLLDMEDDLRNVKALGNALWAIFESGKRPGGLDPDGCVGGSVVVETMLGFCERSIKAWDRARLENARGEGLCGSAAKHVNLPQ